MRPFTSPHEVSQTILAVFAARYWKSSRLGIRWKHVVDVVNDAVSVGTTEAGRCDTRPLEGVSGPRLSLPFWKSIRGLGFWKSRVGGICPCSRAATTLRIPERAHAPSKWPRLVLTDPTTKRSSYSRDRERSENVSSRRDLHGITNPRACSVPGADRRCIFNGQRSFLQVKRSKPLTTSVTVSGCIKSALLEVAERAPSFPMAM